ncbi:hypothetical protein [Arthrobacter sp. 2MCAF14]|uniref:hypothetical protein n=1 Tax=Arthrobacter sp. 2MCAF14 TaxID=3232982 RepID=UPI003F93BE47
MSATIIAFPSESSRKPRWVLSPEEISGLHGGEIVSELADIVTTTEAFGDPIAADAMWLLTALNDKLPELYEVFEELYEELEVSGRLTADLIEGILKAAEPAIDQRQAYLVHQREFYQREFYGLAAA